MKEISAIIAMAAIFMFVATSATLIGSGTPSGIGGLSLLAWFSLSVYAGVVWIACMGKDVPAFRRPPHVVYQALDRALAILQEITFREPIEVKHQKLAEALANDGLLDIVNDLKIKAAHGR